MSMAEAAAAEDGNRLIHVSSYEGWDAGMIYVSVVYRSVPIQALLSRQDLPSITTFRLG